MLLETSGPTGQASLLQPRESPSGILGFFMEKQAFVNTFQGFLFVYFDVRFDAKVVKGSSGS